MTPWSAWWPWTCGPGLQGRFRAGEALADHGHPSLSRRTHQTLGRILVALHRRKRKIAQPGSRLAQFFFFLDFLIK